MKRLVLFVWLLLPVAAGAYHYGPGQDLLRDDRTAEAVERAQTTAREARKVAAMEGDSAAKALWADADEAYGEALALVRDEHAELARTLRLERAKAQMFCSKLPDARRELDQLLSEVTEDADTDLAFVDQVREALANAQYYSTWLMRLEGAPREEWEREVDASRQNYKLIAEHAEATADADAVKKAKENLESAIALARMELTELQGLPLPSQ